MWQVRAVVRSVMLAGMFVEAGVELLLKRPATRLARAEWLHRFCARSMQRMGITIAVHGDFPQRGSLITNHRSYLDIITLAALRPCVFVSKAELVKVPVIGWMTTMAGTVFVERGRGGTALRASAGMKSAMEAGLPVVFFPEGTTHQGPDLLPFRSGLLAQVMAANEPVSAGFLRYAIGPDNEAGVSAEQHIAWGDEPMFRHVFRLLGLRGVHAEVRFAPAPVTFSRTALHRKLAAVEARDAVEALGAAPPTA